MSAGLPLLELDDLHVRVEEAEILRGVSLTVGEGELHALMGPNGSGKSTLAKTLLADPGYQVTEGRIRFRGEDVTDLGPADRAARGMFLGFQHPEAISGVSVLNFLRQAMAVRKGMDDFSVLEVRMALLQWTQRLGMDERFASRYLNEGFSGGERKKNEILQMAMLEPDFAVLDETDSGLDIDALRIVSEGVNAMRGDERGFLIITHHTRILGYVKPDFVHILINGKIVREGGSELADELEAKGYEFVREAVAANGA